MAKYRQKGVVDGPAVDVITGQFNISIDELMKAPSAKVLIAMRAVEVSEDMLAAWEMGKDKLELVPEEGS